MQRIVNSVDYLIVHLSFSSGFFFLLCWPVNSFNPYQPYAVRTIIIPILMIGETEAQDPD